MADEWVSMQDRLHHIHSHPHALSATKDTLGDGVNGVVAIQALGNSKKAFEYASEGAMGARHVQATLADARRKMESAAHYCAQFVANDKKILSKDVDPQRPPLCDKMIHAARRFRELQAPVNTLMEDFTNVRMKSFLARNATGEAVGEPLPPLGYVNDGGFLRPTFQRVHPTPTASVPPMILELPYSLNIAGGNKLRGMNPYMTPQQSAKLDLGRYDQADKDAAFDATHGPVYTPQVALSPASEKHVGAAYEHQQAVDHPTTWAQQPMKERRASLAENSMLKAENAPMIAKGANKDSGEKQELATEQVHKTSVTDSKTREKALEHDDYDDAVPETEKAGISDKTKAREGGFLGAITRASEPKKDASVANPTVIPDLQTEEQTRVPEVKPLPVDSGLVPVGADRQEAGDLFVEATATQGKDTLLPKTNTTL